MAVTLSGNTKPGFYHTRKNNVRVSSPKNRYPYTTHEEPLEFTGVHPIDEPSYTNNVEHLMVLDKNWIVLVLNNMTLLFNEIDSLSGGQFSSLYNTHMANVAALSVNYIIRNQAGAIHNQYLGKARKNIGEMRLAETSSYQITSRDDANYISAQLPSQADRHMVSTGGDKVYAARFTQEMPDDVEAVPAFTELNDGAFPMEYTVYCYLQMPYSMVDGKNYTVTLSDDTGGGAVSFVFDRKKTISRAIKINQVGYSPSAGTKKAYMGCHLYQFGELDLAHATSFEVINAETGATALSGSVSLIEASPVFEEGVDDRPMYGEHVYLIDISSLSATGTFFISVPGVGRSWPFKHSTETYAEIYHTAMRGLFHHRAGMEIVSKYSHWTRTKAKMGPYFYESEHVSFPLHDPDTPAGYNVFNVIGGTINYSQPTTQVAGGYHDAGDWDCRDYHYCATFDMLFAYKWNSSNLTDNQLDIPESGNGVPDILSEARHSLEVWRASQQEDGGVSGYLECETHPKINSYSKVGLFNKSDYGYSQRTRWSSLLYAAAAAMYAELVSPFDSSDSATYQQSAIDAFNFGKDSANSLGTTTINYVDNRGAGPGTGSFQWTELESHVDPYLMFAKLRLYLLTGTSSYITDSPSVSTLDATIQAPYVWQWQYKDWSQYVRYSIIEAYNAGATSLATEASTWTSWFTSEADTRVNYLNDAAYEITYERTKTFNVSWGNLTIANHNRGLAIAYELTSNAKYKNAMYQNMDHLLGCNAMGMSWTTGMGYTYPIDLQNEVSRNDPIMDPVPGITIYNLTGSTINNFVPYRDYIRRAPADSTGATAGASISSLSQSEGTATAITSEAHGLATGDLVQIQNAEPTEYNIWGAVITVTGTHSFTYDVPVSTTTPATGSPVWWYYFATHPSQVSIPFWRAWMIHPANNIGQCEYTIHETMSCASFTGAYLNEQTDTPVQKEPRPNHRLWGRWYLV